MNLIKMAWRNLWRNRRRTLITAASLYFAIVFAIMMRSMQLGTYNLMIDSAVKSYSGYIQIMDSTYWLDKTIDDMMVFDDSVERKITSVPGVVSVLPRLETFTLISSGTKTKGAMIQGIVPERDDEMTGMSKHLVDGKYISSDSKGVVLSSRLASFLGVTVGDTVVMISQGYHGVSAADQYPVQGILKVPVPTLDNKLVIMPLNLVRDFTTAEGLVTSVAINIDDKENMDAVAAALTKTLAGTSLEVLKWTEMNKVLKQQIEGDNASGIIMLGILYMVIFFGILGTIIMMTSERIREFGVMTAVGMKRFKILIMMMLETILIGIIGLLAGVITTIPFIVYYMENPIRIGGEMAKAYEAYGIEPLMGFSGDPLIIINQFYTVLLLMILTLAYPVIKIARLNIINALRG